MSRDQSVTFGLIVFLVVLVVALRVTKIPAMLLALFTYTPTKLDLTPINPNFDWSQLVPHINIGGSGGSGSSTSTQPAQQPTTSTPSVSVPTIVGIPLAHNPTTGAIFV